MGRWEPDAKGRLAVAALDLYTERGYEQTTVADIAERAGVTERTFFRHFADKREVLFDGSHLLDRTAVEAILDAPDPVDPVTVAGAAMARAGAVLEGRRAHATRRAAVIASHPSLQERELLKLAHLGDAMAEALRSRGVRDPAAALAAAAGVSVFHVGFARWIQASDAPTLTACISDALAELTELTASPATASRPG